MPPHARPLDSYIYAMLLFIGFLDFADILLIAISLRFHAFLDIFTAMI